MTQWSDLVLVAALGIAASASCKRTSVPGDPLALPEDPYGVAGAPRDENRFDFDVDADPPPMAPLLDGVARWWCFALPDRARYVHAPRCGAVARRARVRGDRGSRGWGVYRLLGR